MGFVEPTFWRFRQTHFLVPNRGAKRGGLAARKTETPFRKEAIAQACSRVCSGLNEPLHIAV